MKEVGNCVMCNELNILVGENRTQNVVFSPIGLGLNKITKQTNKQSINQTNKKTTTNIQTNKQNTVKMNCLIYI